MVSRSLTVREVAKELGLPSPQVLNRINRGTIKAKKFGPIWVVSRSEVNRVKRESVAPTYFVYAHYTPGPSFFYVGKCRGSKVNDLRLNRRGDAYDQVLTSHGVKAIQTEIKASGLTLTEASAMESQVLQELRQLGHPITNLEVK